MAVRIKICKEEGCQNAQTAGGFCRLHYLKNWKRVKKQTEKKAADKLNKYVERMMRQYPDRYVDEIKKDLRTRKFEQNVEEEFGDPDTVYRLFSDMSFDEEVDRLIHDLKIEKEF
ncbi:MAG: hypothetical protein HY543_10755 [Deltaproteobacteria bacterium]|nr:hypothetical protein [Deltaproteobacteria bacterium]